MKIGKKINQNQKGKIGYGSVKKVLFILLLLVSYNALSWGLTAHRIIGEIAQNHISKKAKKNLKRVFGQESLAFNANWMDLMKSNPDYSYMWSWHYCTIPDDKTYEQIGTPPEKDIIWALNNTMGQLKSDTLNIDEERFALRLLIHLVGDIHQPLHVGNGKDKGGNDVKVLFFGKKSNLHRVWDSEMIDYQKLSFTEWTRMLDNYEKKEIKKLQSSTVLTWANESKMLRASVYDIKGKDISYRYIYEHKYQVKIRLKEAGIRLAGILNEIYK